MIITAIMIFDRMSKIFQTVPEDRGLLNFWKVQVSDFFDMFYLRKGWTEGSLSMIALLGFKLVILLLLAAPHS